MAGLFNFCEPYFYYLNPKQAQKTLKPFLNVLKGHDRVGIYTDYAEPMVVQFLRILTDGYLTYGKQDRTCGSVSHYYFLNLHYMINLYFPAPNGSMLEFL